jgi:Domain of unknown function (DUF1839)
MTATRLTVIPGLDPQQYQRSALHGEACAWPEKNCYVDLFIGLVHALGLEPRAMLASTLSVDFEGDQWTFYKPQHTEMRALFGVDVQEMNCWRPLIAHAREHLAAGRLIAVESDAFWLPDTAGTDYRQQHVKTTIMLNDLDESAERLGYFHNAGYHQLEGEDFRRTFRLPTEPDPDHLPLFAELVRIDRVVRHGPTELCRQARAMASQYLAWAPTDNPIRRFAQRFAQELPVMHELGLPYYHAWAFSTVRQLGAAFELAAAHLAWLDEVEGQGERLHTAVASFQSISQSCKALILKLARAVNAKRQLDPEAVFGPMAQAWDEGMACTRQALA